MSRTYRLQQRGSPEPEVPLRTRVESAIGKALSDDQWAELDSRALVHAAETDGDWGFDELVFEARELVRQRSSPQRIRRRKKETVIEAVLSPAEGLRAEVLGRYLAKAAEQDPMLKRFREGTLGGDQLRPEEILPFLRSPAAQCFSKKQFKDRGIPVLRHSASLIDPDMVRVDPPGSDYPLEGSPIDWLTFIDKSGFESKHRFWQGSVVEAIHLLAQRIAKKYGWLVHHAIVCILTGKAPPRASALRTTLHAGVHRTHEVGSITLTVQPWVSEATLRQAYRKAQQEMLRRNKRQLSLKNLELFAFVIDSTDSIGCRWAWSKILKTWNSKNREKAYRNERILRRDFVRAWKALVFPEYAISGNPLTYARPERPGRSFFCHGAPDPKLLEEILAESNARVRKLQRRRTRADSAKPRAGRGLSRPKAAPRRSRRAKPRHG